MKKWGTYIVYYIEYNSIFKEGYNIMGYALKVYEAFKDDEIKAKVLAEFIEKVEEAINNNQVATQQDLHVQELKLTKEIKEAELRLTKEIEQVRADLSIEIEKVRSDLSVEIEKVRSDLSVEIEKVRSDLSVEIEKVRASLSIEIEKVQAEVQRAKVSILKWLIGLLLAQTITIISAMVGLFQVLK